VLGDLIDQSGYERKEFARLLGVSDDILSNLCRGVTRITTLRREKIAHLLKMGDDDLRDTLRKAAAGISSRRPSVLEVRSDKGPLSTVNIRGKIIVVPKGMVPVPIYGSVPAGTPGQSFSDAIDVEFMPEMNGGFERWGRWVVGDSMTEEFRNGDIVIFEGRRAFNNQAVYAIKDGDECFKIYRETPEGAVLAPLNDCYEPFSAEGWDILGVICERIRVRQDGRKNREEYPPNFQFRP